MQKLAEMEKKIDQTPNQMIHQTLEMKQTKLDTHDRKHHDVAPSTS